MTTKTKELKIRRKQPYVLYEIYYEGGGEVPQELQGSYTKEYVAQQRIDAYVAGKKPNGTKSTTRAK